MIGMLRALCGRFVGASRLSRISVGQVLALLTVIVASLAYSPAAQAQNYSYSPGGQTIVYNGSYSYWGGYSLFGSSSTSGDNVSYFAYTVPAGKTYTSARLDFGFTVHSGGTYPLTFSALSGQPADSAAGINAIRSGGTLATIGSMTAGPVTLPGSVVTAMNSLSAGGGGTLYIGAYGPSGVDYFGEFYQANLVGETTEPNVTGLSPTSGGTSGGTSVTITGTNFTGATSVTFGGTNATGVTVLNATTITATSPARAAGVADVRVTTPVGISANTAADNFTYIAPAPTVTSISPSAGPTAGGTPVTITGTNFTGATAVNFGASAATGITVVNATTITATSPAGSVGTVDVRVTTPGGTSATSAADQFTYTPAPTVSGLSPSTGPSVGGTTVTITGTNFTGATAVVFGANAATGITVNSNTQITATSPAGLGVADVRVTTAGGTSPNTVVDNFSYILAPTVTSISPTAGPTGGGTTVTITGANFTDVTAVNFGATPATGFTFNSATSITATSPAGSVGTVDVRVTAPGGTSAISAADQFTYIAAPTVTSISPTAGPTAGGTSVTITGTGFSTATAVTFNGVSATGITVESGTRITATSPAHAAGTVDIRVTNLGGTSVTSAADQFTYVTAPTVTSITPTAGPTSGGTTVIITGTGFATAPGTGAVQFGGTTATYTVNSNTQITATSPAHSAGTIDVTVTTAGGTSATSAADQFTYIPAPTVTSISPTAGPVAGGTSVTITGANFTGVSAVTFGATAASGFTFNGPTSITATAPAGSAGTVDIRVTTTAGGTSATSAADQFTFLAAPVATSFTYGFVVPYNAGAATATSFNVGSLASNNPTNYAVGSATTAQGGSVSINSSGQISYTPPVGYRNANDSFTYTASNAGGTSSPATVTVTVGNPTFSVTLPSATGLVGAAYNSAAAAVTMTGGSAPYGNFSASGLPNGLSMSSSGVISGTPTTAGSATVTITATDSSTGSGPFTATATASLTVAGPAFTVAPGSLPNGVAGVGYSQTITTTGGTAPYSYFISFGDLPAGLSLSSGGVLSGTPTATGTFNVIVTVTDSTTGAGAPFMASEPYSLTITQPPLILAPASGALPGATQETAYSQTFTTSGGVAGYSYAVTSGALPSGLTLAPGGTLSGTPTVNGTFNFSVTASDSSTGAGSPATVIGTYSLAVALPAPPTAGPLTTTVAANSGAGPVTLSLTGTTATSVAVFTPPVHGTTSIAGLTITYTPTPGFSGSDSFTYTATNAGGTSAPATVTVTVSAPTLTLSAVPTTGQVTASYSTGLTASLGTAPYSFARTSGSLPTGVTLASDGTLSGTPTAAGTFNFTVEATDTYGATGSRAYSVAIAAPAITITSPAAGALPGVVAGTAYSQTFSASGGQGAHVFAVTAGALPTGLTLSPAGVLSGTPTTAATFNFTVGVTDSSPAPGPYAGTSLSYSITVTAPTIVLSPAAGALPGGLITVPYSQTFTASGGTAAYGFAVTGGALPGGLNLSAGGVLSGTPTLAGSYGFTVTATDALGFDQAAAYTLEIGTPVPVVTAKTATVVAGQSVTIDASQGATGPGLIGAQIATGPAHGTATVNGLIITYTANGAYAGEDSFTYTVSNPGGLSVPATVTITVNPAVVAGPPKAVTIMAGQTAVVELTEGATGSPFTGAAVVSVSPAEAGTATIAGRTGPAGQLYDLTFKPDNAFTGQAVVSYTLSNAFATSAPGTVTITVEARPDPTQDAEVTALIGAQTESARRFATAQISNFNRRLERLHGGGTGEGGGFSSSLSFTGGNSAMGGGMASDPSELRRMQDSFGVMGGLTGRGLGFDGASPSSPTQDRRVGAGSGGSATGPWSVWASGAVSFGTADAAANREGLEFDTDGLTIGADRRFGDKLVLGGGVGWAHDVSKIGDNGTRSAADAWSLSLYGSYQPVKEAFVDVVLGYGKLDFDSRRYVTANGDFAYGQRNGDQWFGALTAGWDYSHEKGLKLSPYGRIEASQSVLDAFTEEGGGAFALHYEEQSTTTVTGAMGLRGDYALKTRFGQAVPSFRIEYAYDLKGTGAARIRYADWLDGDVYTMSATPYGKNRMLYGLGIDMIRKSGTRFGLDYEGMLSDDQTSSTVRIMLETSF